MSKLNVALVVVTHNRLEYTRKAVSRLLEDSSEEFDLYIWDNCSRDGTQEFLASLHDNRISEIVFSDKNLGQSGAMNYCWGKSKAELVGKLDNDCLITPGWTRTLVRAHRDVDMFGAIACWHYPVDEFDESGARKAGKIQSFGGHEVLRHPWVCGSGFIMKRRTFEEYGQWRVGPDVGTTYYFVKMARGGCINGWYFPLLLQEHMDDPRSKHCLVNDDEGIRTMYDVTYTLRTSKIMDMRSRWARRPIILKDLNSGPWHVKHYVGWRGFLRRAKSKLVSRLQKASSRVKD